MGSRIIPTEAAARPLLFIPFALVGCTHVQADATPSECVSCHPSAVATWEDSLHAVAGTHPVFAISHAETAETLPDEAAWCTTCHAPEGVTCADCHGPEARSCVACHEMDLPSAFVEGRPVPSGTLAQSTASEWAISSAGRAGRACSDCHPPHADTHGSAPQRLRETLTVDVRAEAGSVVATIAATELGHAFPTGDPFRRLVLTLCADLACQRPTDRWVLERRLKRDAEGNWVLAHDSRIPPPTSTEPSRVTRRFDDTAAKTWRLTYHRTDPDHAGRLGAMAGFVVATGRVEGT